MEEIQNRNPTIDLAADTKVELGCEQSEKRKEKCHRKEMGGGNVNEKAAHIGTEFRKSCRLTLHRKGMAESFEYDLRVKKRPAKKGQ